MKKELNENQKVNDFKNLEKSDSQNSNEFYEIDIFSKKYGFDEQFIAKMLNPDCKWKEKKESFDKLTKLTEQSSINSIKNTDRTNFIDMVKKLLKQPNINVNHSIINALNNLSLGLKSDFNEAKDLFPHLLTFLKEKKDSIINSLITCLCHFSFLINDNIINDKLLDYCTKKPLPCNIAKINLCNFIEKLIDRKENIQLNCYIPLIINISKYLDDPNPNVRDKSCKLFAFINYKKKEILVSISKSINLDEKKKNKIEEYENLYINLSCNNTNKKNVNLSSDKKCENKINSNIKKNNICQKLINNKTKEIPYQTPKISSDENKNKQTSKKFGTTSKTSNENSLLLIKDSLIDNKEEIIMFVQKKIPDLDNSLFNSLDWNERKNGFNLLNMFLNNEENIEEINNSYDYYFKYILISNRFFNEKNCMVLIESISCVNTLIDKINDFSEKYYKLMISLMINKLNEKKVAEEISITMQKLSNKLLLDDVIMTFISNLNNKSNLIVKEGAKIIKRIIDNSNTYENRRISEKTQSKYDEICSINKINNSKISSGKKIFKYEISKSPLMSTKKNNNLSKYNYNIIDVLPPDQNELPNYIKNLYEKDIILKNLSLSEIKKILIHSKEKDSININVIKDILSAFNNIISSIIKNINEKNGYLDKNELILIRYLLDDYLLIAYIKSLIIKLNDTNIIYNSYEQLLLLISEKNIKVLNCGTEILNIINKIILCLLTNFQKTLTINALIKIISIHKSSNNQIDSLAIKCLDKFRKILSQINNEIDNNSIFVSLYNFFFDFSKTNEKLEPKNENEKNALLMIKYLINEYIHIYNKSIWDIYRKSLDNDMQKYDIYFKRTIEILLREFNSKNKLESLKKNNNFIENLSKDSPYNKIIEEIMHYANKLKQNDKNMTEEEKNKCYNEIVYLLRTNKINSSILSNKIEGDTFAKIFERYNGINSSKDTQDLSQSIKTKSKINKNINQKEKDKIKKDEVSQNKKVEKLKKENKNNSIKKDIKNKVETSEQSKRILEYKKKYKYFTENNKNRNQITLEKLNDENKQINNNNINTVNNNRVVKIFDDISLNNKNNLINNNPCVSLEEISKMKKQLEEIKKNVK